MPTIKLYNIAPYSYFRAEMSIGDINRGRKIKTLQWVDKS